MADGIGILALSVQTGFTYYDPPHLLEHHLGLYNSLQSQKEAYLEH